MENAEITVTLTAAKWNVVLNALSQRPFNEVSAIIAEIMEQGKSQVPPVSEPKPE